MSMMVKDPVKRPQVVCGPSRTQQHLADLCSPKRLVEKYGSKRLKEALSREPAMFSDIPLAGDFKEAMDIIAKGQTSFDALPSGLRKRFGNDPYQLLEFLNDVKNRDEAIELGLIPRPAVTDEPVADDVKKASDEPVIDAESSPKHHEKHKKK